MSFRNTIKRSDPVSIIPRNLTSDVHSSISNNVNSYATVTADRLNNISKTKNNFINNNDNNKCQPASISDLAQLSYLFKELNISKLVNRLKLIQNIFMRVSQSKGHPS